MNECLTTPQHKNKIGYCYVLFKTSLVMLSERVSSLIYQRLTFHQIKKQINKQSIKLLKKTQTPPPLPIHTPKNKQK